MSDVGYIGLRILVTRQMIGGIPLMQAIHKQGLEAYFCPLLKILPITDPVKLTEYQEVLKRSDLVIFTSVSAIDAVMPFFDKKLVKNTALSWACVGEATAKRLRSYGVEDIIRPKGKPFNSESLLDSLRIMSVQGITVALFKGQEGRELIETTLLKRKAEVIRLVCYCRIVPVFAIGKLLHTIKTYDINVIIVTCETTLDYLTQVSRSFFQKMKEQTLLVVSNRIKKKAIASGWTDVYTTKGASNNDILAGLCQLQDLDIAQCEYSVGSNN